MSNRDKLLPLLIEATRVTSINGKFENADIMTGAFGTIHVQLVLRDEAAFLEFIKVLRAAGQ